ncbi:DNA polymerase I [Acidithiobacillus albertensis]|jgi:DNA polymerase-1|uniref:DNA polymerase I n=1 Tax=Acidithiobacillus albertensis TaxID=119978 RepID=UPI00094B2BBC|nr:DNA polymerase I [Acidithiobacillus albertensis]
MPQDPRILVDASSFLYRAFHALPDLRAPDNLPTGAIFGVANMLRRLAKEYPSDEIIVVFDAPGGTFRDRLYPEYKAQRPAMPEDLRAQIPLLHEWIQATGLPLVLVPDVEADDVIGTLAGSAQAGQQVIIVTGDKDMAQLVNDQVTLLDTMKGVKTDVAGVWERYGVAPERIADLLALTGDKVDNIPGVPGAGPKTAAKWIQQYGSLDGVLAHADEIGGKIGEALRASLDYLPLSLDLTTIRRNLHLPEQSYLRAPENTQKLRSLALRLGFHAWLKEYPAEPGTEDTGVSVNESAAGGLMPIDRSRYRAITTPAALENLLQKLQQADLVALDTETTALDPLNADLVGISCAWQEGDQIEAVYIPIGHRDDSTQLVLDHVLATLRPWLENPLAAKLAQNAKYDWRVFWRYDIHPAGLCRDTLLESYILDSSQNNHDLDTLAQRHLQHQNITYEEVAGKGKAARNFADVPVSEALPYAAEDADVCWRIDAQLWPRFANEAGLQRVLMDIEMPLVLVLARMEQAGVRVDKEQLKTLSMELGRDMAACEAQAFKSAGQSFNLGSPKQIQEILFDKMQLPVLKKTPGGQPSTSEDVLAQLAVQADLPRLILEYRGMAKLKNTYADALPEMINPRTGRVHTHFQQAVAATGRLSSSAPNLQNIPVRTEQGRRIRQAFVAEDGFYLLSADYSQIELRIMAHLSRDARLLQAFAEGQDIHAATAAEVFNLAPEAVDSDARRAAKAINFGLIYGQTPYGLAQQLGIEQSAARAYMDRYFERYPGVLIYMEQTRVLARQQGYVETLFGRRLYVPEIRSSNAARRNYAERAAINAPMQGTAADLIKKAMIAVDAWLQENPVRGRMILQVHDELILEVPESGLEAARAALKELMEGVADLAVPLLVGLGVGKHWDAAHG